MRSARLWGASVATLLFAGSALATPPDCDLLRMVREREVPYPGLDDDLVNDRIDQIIMDQTGLPSSQAIDGAIDDALDGVESEVDDATGDQAGLRGEDEEFFDRHRERYLLYRLLCDDPEPDEEPGFDRPLGEPEDEGDPVFDRPLGEPEDEGEPVIDRPLGEASEELPPLEGDDSAVDDLLILEQWPGQKPRELEGEDSAVDDLQAIEQWRQEQRKRDREQRRAAEKLSEQVPEEWRRAERRPKGDRAHSVPDLPIDPPRVSPPARKY